MTAYTCVRTEDVDESVLPVELQELSESQLNAHAQLKELCIQNDIFWQKSKLDGGAKTNDDLDLLYALCFTP